MQSDPEPNHGRASSAPGSAGSGAVLVRANRFSGAAALLCSAAVSHVTTNTPHQAEYRGLLACIFGARTLGLPSLEVIGTNALLLRQLREHRPSRNRALHRLYQQAQALAGHLRVPQRTRHSRAHNKTADSQVKSGIQTGASLHVNQVQYWSRRPPTQTPQ